MNRFEGQCIAVTGGASGIGSATATAIVREGGNVVIADIQHDKGKALADSLGPSALFQPTDVTNESDIERLVRCSENAFGALNGMVNNAGILGVTGPITETTTEAFDRTMAVLSRAVFLGIKHAAIAMKEAGGGSIVSVASTAGLMGGLGPHVYTMAKHGVIGLTKSAANELAGFGIRVNTVAPGGTVTPLAAALTAGSEALLEEAIKSASPLGISCRPEDVADGILYLLSEQARNVSGHTLIIDAGLTSGPLQTQFHSEQHPARSGASEGAS